MCLDTNFAFLAFEIWTWEKTRVEQTWTYLQLRSEVQPGSADLQLTPRSVRINYCCSKLWIIQAVMNAPVYHFQINFNWSTLGLGFPGGSVVKNLPANARDTSSIPGSGRSPGVESGNPLQYSCLGNPMDRGAWQANSSWVQRVKTWLSNWTTTNFMFTMLVGTH